MKVIVTAAASGIGLAIARRFVTEGAQVFIGDIDGDALARVTAETEGISGAVADVSDHGQVRAFIARAVDALGGVDVFVNNVGIAGPTCLTEKVAFEEWDLTMKVNLGSHFYCSREIIPHLKKQKSGLILSISSIAGQFGYPFHGPYAVSKAAVIALTRTLAMELGPHNVRANTICPCAVGGPRTTSVIETESRNTGVPLDLVQQAYMSQNSMRTFIEADEIAALAVYLASPAAKRISGQTIAVDGNAETLRLPVGTWENVT
jgi:NAD(P)-dependent dehydrogenase (short-subunit alcohol dehydrogenase family)